MKYREIKKIITIDELQMAYGEGYSYLLNNGYLTEIEYLERTEKECRINKILGLIDKGLTLNEFRDGLADYYNIYDLLNNF